MEINKFDVVKLVDGREVRVINLPNTFMSNGSYEVSFENKTFWIKPEEILYKIDPIWFDSLSNYFEIIYDESGINIIPKELDSIDIESDREDINRIKLSLFEGRKHKVINIHIGDTVISDKDSIVKLPTKKKKSKIEKVINIIKGEEDEV